MQNEKLKTLVDMAKTNNSDTIDMLVAEIERLESERDNLRIVIEELENKKA